MYYLKARNYTAADFYYTQFGMINNSPHMKCPSCRNFRDHKQWLKDSHSTCLCLLINCKAICCIEGYKNLIANIPSLAFYIPFPDKYTKSFFRENGRNDNTNDNGSKKFVFSLAEANDIQKEVGVAQQNILANMSKYNLLEPTVVFGEEEVGAKEEPLNLSTDAEENGRI